MISFLAPAALLGSLLLAIPILVHLFKPRKVRVTQFSSLRWLHLTQQRLARRIQWHQILLFLLRAAFITLLVFALARPMFNPRGGGGLTERFIILDVTRSMAYQAEGRPSPIEWGKQIAADLMLQGVGGDRTAVLLAGSTARILAPLSTDPEGYLTALRSVTPTLTDGNLAAALEAVRPLLADRRETAGIELVFITDNQQRAWDQVAIAEFLRELGDDARHVRVRVIDAGVIGAQNAWIASARMLEFGSGASAKRVIRVQSSCIGDASQKRTLRLTGVAGQPERSQPVTLEPGRLVSADFELPISLDLRSQVARIEFDPQDALPSDDRWFLNLDPRGSLRVVVVEPESNRPESLKAAFHLRTALSALKMSNERGLDIAARTSGNVSARELADADITFLCNVPELPEPVVAAIESRVAAGGGLAIFLGPDIKPDFYNTRLRKHDKAAQSILPGTLSPAPAPNPTANIRRPEPTLIASVRWANPILAPLQDPVFGDLAQARMTPNLRLDLPPADASKAIAWIGETTPAIVEHSLGAGRVLLFNTSANDAWTDLPRKRSFVPLLDRVVSHLSGGGARRTFNAGENVTLPAPELKPGERLEIITPGNQRVPARLRSLASTDPSAPVARSFLQVDTTQEVGVYRVEKTNAAPEPDGKSRQDAAPDAKPAAGQEIMSFVVQAGRGDSVLAPIDSATLQRWWAPAPFESQAADIAGREAATRFGRLPLWPWLVALGSLVLLAEMFFVHHLCPRMNPVVVESVVHRRGLIVPRPSGVTNS